MLAAVVLAVVLSTAAAAAEVRPVSVDGGGTLAGAIPDDVDVSADGRFVVFASAAGSLVPGDRNAASDLFVRDMRRGTMVRLPAAPAGDPSQTFSSSPAISPDGRYVAFTSYTSTTNPFGSRTDAFIGGPLR